MWTEQSVPINLGKREAEKERENPIKRKEAINFREKQYRKRLGEEKERGNDVIIDLWPPHEHTWAAALTHLQIYICHTHTYNIGIFK